jgi:hypothetical protein
MCISFRCAARLITVSPLRHPLASDAPRHTTIGYRFY